MADKSFQFRLITPQGKLLDAPARAVVLPQHDGSSGQLPDHAAFVVKLGLGELRVDFAADKGGSRVYLIEDGFAQMVGNKLTVLTTRAFAAEEITEQAAQAELAGAEARRPAKAFDAAETLQIQRDRDRARAKLRLARSRAGKGI